MGSGKPSYWLDNVRAIISAQLARDKASMAAAVGRPMLRRPNTAAILESALAHPESIPPQGEEALGRFARERYGEAAQWIYPYLGLGPDGKAQVMSNELGPGTVQQATSVFQ